MVCHLVPRHACVMVCMCLAAVPLCGCVPVCVWVGGCVAVAVLALLAGFAADSYVEYARYRDHKSDANELKDEMKTLQDSGVAGAPEDAEEVVRLFPWSLRALCAGGSAAHRMLPGALNGLQVVPIVYDFKPEDHDDALLLVNATRPLDAEAS